VSEPGEKPAGGDAAEKGAFGANQMHGRFSGSKRTRQCQVTPLVEALNGSDVAYVPRAYETIGAGARLRMAVRAAIRTFRKTGRLVYAALTYAQFGFPIFPLDVPSKAPIPRRDPDPTGKLKKGIPKTGGVYKATCNPLQIIAWWQKKPKALIALPMGPRSGVWCLDVDTPEDHADGVAGWGVLGAQHDPIVTREHRSATGGPHLIFIWSEALPIRCSKGSLSKGIEVKGAGGYIVVPPSVRKGRAYSVFADIDPVKAPAWLSDLILQDRPAKASDDVTSFASKDVDVDELAEALRWIPNPHFDWTEWKNMALRIFASVGDLLGFPLFCEWSQKCPDYDPRTGPAEDRECWQEVKGSPPDRTGSNKIFALARENGWTPKLQVLPALADDPIKLDDEIPIETAREEVKQQVRDFLDMVARPESELRDNPYLAYYFETRDSDWPLVQALRVPTGVGKTKITIAELAPWLHATGAGPIVYAVPRHRLGRDIVKPLASHGINARLFYGRDAPDLEQVIPGKPEDQQIKMCLNQSVVALAMRARADIFKTCCKDGKKRCPFFTSCGYIRQMEDAEEVQVWIVAADMLFHAQRAFGKPAAVIIDESFWQRGLRGLEPKQQAECLLPIASLSNGKLVDLDQEPMDAGQRDYLRTLLGNVLGQQKQNGPIERKQLQIWKTPAFTYGGKTYRSKTYCSKSAKTLYPHDCTRAINLEWKLMSKFPLRPGMNAADFPNLEETIDAIRHARNIITIWKEIRTLLLYPNISVSGRLELVQDNGQRAVQWRGVASIKKQYWKPTLLLDATLPEESVLKVYHPQVDVLPELRVAMPTCVHIKQVLDASTSANKLNSEKHLQAVRRYIVQRWYETGKQKTLVICQQKVERWLKRRGLPTGIDVEHYNALSGLDDYRDVRLQILIGRTAPGPATIEMLAATLNGQQPTACKPARPGAFAWYQPIERGIKLRDGRMIKTDGDLHPDAVAEPVRWHICEGELVQALGRSRALNRTADKPLDIDLLFDPVLPVAVDQVVRWRTPSLLLETLADEGVMLTAPCDLVKLWPATWPNEKHAYRTVQSGVPELPELVAVEYQLTGAGMNRRTGYFDLIRVPDPDAWLARRIGPVI
jgi:bifunctional DNA primase/polymerase-like protein